jgi:hypothetical protein
LSGEIDSFLFRDLVSATNSGLVVLSLGNASTWTAQNNVEVHTKDTNSWVILQAEIDVFSNTKPEVAFLRETGFWKFIRFDTKSFFDDVDSLFTTDCYFGGDLLTTTDTKPTDCEARFTERWLLLCELLNNLSSLGELIAFTSNAALDDKLVYSDLSHWIHFLSH